MFDFLSNWWAYILAFLLAFGVIGCSFAGESPGSSFAVEQNLDGSGLAEAEGELHLAWELPVVSTLGDLFDGLGGSADGESDGDTGTELP